VGAARRNRHYGRSLALAKFNLHVERVLRAHAFLECAGDYGARWWAGHARPLPARITRVPGDDRQPFASIDLPPDAYLSAAADGRTVLRALFVVGIAAAFETYLYDVHSRALFLRPTLIGGDRGPNPSFTAAELVEAEQAPSFRWWLAQEVTERRLRGPSHETMVERVAALIPVDVRRGANRAHLTAWSRWSLVRNAIAHAAMSVGPELAENWPERFPQKGARIELEFHEVGGAGAAALSMARTLDTRFVSEIVEASDAELLVRETFARLGVGDVAELSRRAHSILGAAIRRPQVEAALAVQRATTGEVHGFRFLDELLRP
jgi:hypothetical protein